MENVALKKQIFNLFLLKLPQFFCGEIGANSIFKIDCQRYIVGSQFLNILNLNK